MPQFARSIACLLAVLFVACRAEQALADFPENAPAPPYGARGGSVGDERPLPASQRNPIRRLDYEQAETAPFAEPPSPNQDGPGTKAGFSDATAPITEDGARQLPQPRRPLQLSSPATDPRGGTRGKEVPTIVTGAASLGIVLGLFLLVVWVVRRGMPKSAALLPREAVEVLGRAPLVGRQQMHMIRCGNKILLVYVSPGGVETLTEITDPLEVDRLAGVCQQLRPESATASFHQVFHGYGSGSVAKQFFARQAPDDFDFAGLEASSQRSQD